MHLISQYNNIHNFDPATSIPDLTGKVIIVTGGNAGIGKATVLELSRHNPQKLYMAARSQAKYDTAMKDILATNPGANVAFLELDLADIDSIRRAAKTVLSSESRLDVLINNAGILGHPPAVTALNHEIHFGTNYFGPAAFTTLLLPLIRLTATTNNTHPPRIINISSGAAYSGLIRQDPVFTTSTSSPTINTPRADINVYQRYAISKAAQILWTREFARRHQQIVSVAVHPGRVGTGILDDYMADTWQRWSVMGLVQRTIDALVDVLSEERGAATGLWAAVAAVEGRGAGGGGEGEKVRSGKGVGVVSGELYGPVGVWEAGDARCRNEKLAGELWEWTVAELRRFGIEVD